MKKNIEKKVEVPSEISFELNDNAIRMSLKGKEIKKSLGLKNTKIIREENSIKITSNKATKKEGKLIGTAVAHLKNMIKGLQKDFVYHLEVCNVHFPMTIKVEGNKVIIKNFLGETVDRQSEILPSAKVEVKGNTIIVSSPDMDSAGQTAANLERTTKIRNRDRRIFQDGIFITKKAGGQDE